MPGRIVPLITNQIYHVYNRGIDHRHTYLDKAEYKRAKEIVNFYRFSSPPVKYSVFLIWAKERRKKIIDEFDHKERRLINILSYCLMPNHFHFLLKQTVENGISKFMSNFLNSYTRYFNTKHKRIGPIFLDQFKGVRIESDEQLLHVSRYIHLNPYSSYVVKKIDELKKYPWSSLPEFLGLEKGFCQTKEILSYFRTRNSFQKFTLDQADYQRELEAIKHLVFEAQKQI